MQHETKLVRFTQSQVESEEEELTPQVFSELDNNPKITEMRRRKNQVIERIVSTRVKN